MTDLDKNTLCKRCDRYINDEFSDPVAVGLIMELRAHLRAANRGNHYLEQRCSHYAKAYYSLDERLKKLEAGKL